ncbi:MAG TPA: hypothetical protein VGK73_20675 [Polyangiaceae bacterium]
MRLFNQTKNALAWSMGGQSFTCEPWGPVDIPDELVPAAKSRGLPLDVAAMAPEVRAQVRVADERAAADQAPLLALKAQAENAQAGEREAKRELEAMSVELSRVRGELRAANETVESQRGQLQRVTADKEAAEQLMSAAEQKATAAEAKAIRAEALLAEKTEKPKAKRAEASG